MCVWLFLDLSQSIFQTHSYCLVCIWTLKLLLSVPQPLCLECVCIFQALRFVLVCFFFFLIYLSIWFWKVDLQIHFQWILNFTFTTSQLTTYPYLSSPWLSCKHWNTPQLKPVEAKIIPTSIWCDHTKYKHSIRQPNLEHTKKCI